jgi:hypothetical protein
MASFTKESTAMTRSMDTASTLSKMEELMKDGGAMESSTELETLFSQTVII